MSSGLLFPGIGYIRAEGYRNEREESRSRVEMEVGLPRQRRSMAVSPRLFTIEWRFTEAEYLVFENWYRTVIQNGASAFDVELLSDTESFVWYTVRFTEPHQARVIGELSTDWSVSAKLRSKDPPFARTAGGVGGARTDDIRSTVRQEFVGTGYLLPIIHLYGLSQPGIDLTGRLSPGPFRGLVEPNFFGRGALTPAPAPSGTYLVKFKLDGTDGQSTGIVNTGTIGGTYSTDTSEQALSTLAPKYGSASMRTRNLLVGVAMMNVTSSGLLNSGNASKGAIGAWFNDNSVSTEGTDYFRLMDWVLDTGAASNSAGLVVSRDPTNTFNFITMFLTNAVGGVGADIYRQVNISALSAGYHHYEIDWDGTTAYFFVDGVLQASQAFKMGTAVGTTGNISVCRPLWPFNLYVYTDEPFAYSGAALHTANFTPVTLP